jgi:hypothetical protein
LQHNVKRKPTHTKLYLNGETHHHLTNRHDVLSTLVHWTRAICYQENQNSLKVCSNWMATLTGRFIVFSIYREDLTSVAFLLFVQPTFKYISKMLMRHNIKTVGLPPRKVTSVL